MDDTLQWILDQLPEDELRRRYEAVEEEIQGLVRTRNVLRMAIDARNLAVKIDGNEGAPPDALGYQPGTSEAVRRVIADAPYRTATTKEIMEALSERGWLPEAQNPRKAVGATISRMVRRTGELESLGRARYRLLEADPLTAASKETVSNRLFIGSADGEARSEGT